MNDTISHPLFLSDWTRGRNLTRAESIYCFTFILKMESREIESVRSVEWSANFFCKGPDGKYFALPAICSLSYLLNSVIVACMQP